MRRILNERWMTETQAIGLRKSNVARTFNAAPLSEVFSKASIEKLDLTPEFKEEVYWYVRSVDRCSAKQP